MRAQRSILVVEDDLDIAATIAAALRQDGWHSQTASTVAEARLRAEALKPSMVLVDIGLPDGSGMVFVREMASRPDVGILVVSARTDEVDRIVGLELGADDYITKPFSLRELTARVRAISRRMATQEAQSPPTPVAMEAAAPSIAPTMAADPGGPWMFGAVTLDPLRLKLVMTDGTELRLTGAEAGLLRLMLEAPDRTVDRDTIAEQVLGHKLLPHQRGVDQLASMLRRKLAAASDQQIQVLALRGRGYRLVA